MSKKKKQISGLKPQSSSPVKTEKMPAVISFFSDQKNQIWILTLLVFLFYGNSLLNQYALDDGLVVRDNEFVERGVKGIPDILSHDSFYGSIGTSKNLTGGRYRPLSLVSFAIENSLFGQSPFAHHLLNVMFYALTAIVLLLLMRRFIFKEAPLAAFSAAILFVIHPVHTEAIANIKSRDEIFSLLFLLLNLYFLLVYTNISQKTVHLLLSVLFYFLAMFSKENGLTFLLIIPLTLYFFSQKNFSSIVRITLPFIAVAVFYILVRISLIGLQNNEVKGVMDNPYVLATPAEKYATILLVFLKYFQLLIFPYPLTFDYSYNQIPYRNFSDPLVLLSLLLNTLLFAYAIYGLRKKDVISYCILFYFISIFIVSNIFFNIGAPMAERFLFQPSVAFVILIVELVRRAFKQMKWERLRKVQVGIGAITILTLISAFDVIPRNEDWKSDSDLFLHDVKISARSARANTFAGISLIDESDSIKDESAKAEKLKQAMEYFQKSLLIRPDYIVTWENIGVAYVRSDSNEKAETAWNKAREFDPDDENLKQYDLYLTNYFFKKGMKEGEDKNFDASIIDLEKAVKYGPNEAEGWYNLGGAYFSKKDYEKAKACWQKTLQLNPQHQQALNGMNALKQMGL